MDRIPVGGMRATPEIDRFHSRSVYSREPGGILFKSASDDPGLAIDEDDATLGSELKIAAAHESLCTQIEAYLPSLRAPQTEEEASA